MIAWYRCGQCQEAFPVPRRGGSRRAVGHVKHMWCPRCEARTAHTQANR